MYETLPYTESFDNFDEIWFPRVCSVYNQGQNFIGKFTKLSKTHDFLEYFAAFFSQFFSTTVKNWLLGSWLLVVVSLSQILLYCYSKSNHKNVRTISFLSNYLIYNKI